MAKGFSMGGNLPASNVANGLLPHIEDFVNNDELVILAVVEIGVNYSKKPRGSRELEPVLQLEYIEPITGRADIAALEAIIGPVFQARTSENVRPKREKPKPDTPLDMSGLDAQQDPADEGGASDEDQTETETAEAEETGAKVTDIGAAKG